MNSLVSAVPLILSRDTSACSDSPFDALTIATRLGLRLAGLLDSVSQIALCDQLAVFLGCE